jgi:N-acetylated-alpha-linked acidic dipeptidase
VKVKLHVKQDFQFRTIWDVIGKVRGTDLPDEWVVSGNHRDAWVYGAVDPNSGTTAMLETVHGIGDLLKSGWKPKRTMVFASWDAEEEGLIGSTEWGEQYADQLAQAAAYFNVDVAVSGPKFGASSVPSLKQFLRDVTKSVPSPQGGTVYEVWRKATQSGSDTFNPQETSGSTFRPPAAQAHTDVSVGDLGSGSDYTVFLQHLGVPSTDVGSTGSYGVYHSVFDNFNWFKKFGDPNFLYEQEMARIYGLEALRMANADVLPFDYEEYGKEILAYLDAAKKKAEAKFGTQSPDFGPAGDAAKHFEEAGAKVLAKERKPPEDTTKLNHALRDAERALLLPEGLPNRPWYKHAIYAPGQYTGYAAVVIPGVNEGIEAGDLERTKKQIAVLAQALQKATHVLESYH